MSHERDVILERLLRAIALSEGEFALLLARCNSVDVRDRLIADLRAKLGSGLFEFAVTPSMGAVNLVEKLEAAPTGTQAASVIGLDVSPTLTDSLAIANHAREEFRKRLTFPLVLWVTDEVEVQLRRQSPDLASWAAPPFGFGLEPSELRTILDRETAQVLDCAFNPERSFRMGPDLKGAWQEWQQQGEPLEPELKARVALALGIDAVSDAAAKEAFKRCLSWQETGEFGAAARYRLGLWWERQGKLNRAEFFDCCDRAREQLQLAWQETAGQYPQVGVALGRVLLALALSERGLDKAEEACIGPLNPPTLGDFDLQSSKLGNGEANATVDATAHVSSESDLSAHWRAVQQFAAQLGPQSDFAHGLLAEVALAQADYKTGQWEAKHALTAPDDGNKGLYLLALGRSQLGLGQPQAAIATLEQAREQVAAEVDPDLHIRLLKALHSAYWADGDYRKAFAVKCDRAAVETEFGFRAFIGAGRLRPGRRLGAMGEAATEEIAASGRQADLGALVERVKRNDCRLTVIHGPSGVGKSSLIRAGLVPTLRQMIHQSRRVVPIVLERYEDWQGELAEQLSVAAPLNPPILGDFNPRNTPGALTPPVPLSSLIHQLQENDRHNLITVIIFDQFEEFFFKYPDLPGRRQLYEFLQACLNVEYVWVFLSLREDYLHFLLECDRQVDFKLINNDILNKNVRYYLGNFSQARAQQVIRELTERSPDRMEAALIERLSADLAADLGEVRPIELQVVGAEMLHSDAKVMTLAQYEALAGQPKQRLVERWLTQVVRDCGAENEALAQRTLMALTEEPEKRPVKSLTELRREVRLRTPELPLEEQDFAVEGDLAFVVRVLIGSGLAFEIPAAPEVGVQLIHDYLVQPIRQQFGGELARQLAEERQKRQLAEANVQKRNRWLLQGSVGAALIFAGLGILAFIFAFQANEQRAKSDLEVLNTEAVVDSLIWKGLIDAQLFNLEDQVAMIEQVKDWQAQLTNLRAENQLELKATVHRAVQLLREKNRFEGHTDSVLSVVFAPDGNSILTGSSDQTAKLWSLDGHLLQTFQGHDSEVLSVAFAPDGNSILTGSSDQTAKLWSRDGRLLQTFQGHDSEVLSVAFAPDGNSILTGSSDQTAKLWSRDGRLLQTFQGHDSEVWSVAFAPDGNSILTGSSDQTAKLWSRDGRLLQTFQGHDSEVWSVAFAPNGNSILTGSSDQTAKLWSRDGRLLQTFQGHDSEVWSVAFAPNGNSILTGSSDQTAKLWSRDGHLLQTFQGHDSLVLSVAFAPDGNSILTGSFDQTAKLWSCDGRLLKTFQGHDSEVESAAFAPNGNSILTGSFDQTAKLWSRDGRLLKTFQGHDSEVWSVAFAPNGNSILTGSSDQTAKLWSRDGRLLKTFQGHDSEVESVAFAPNGNSILTGSSDQTAKLWSLDGRLLQTFQGHDSEVESVAFAPNGNSILTGSSDQTAKLWSLDGRLLQTFQGHDSEVESVAFAPNGNSILTGSSDQTAKLWSLDGRLLQTFQGHDSEVESVAFAPDGNSILTGSRDNTAKLWSRDGRLLQTFQGHNSWVLSVAFAPDGNSILTGSRDQTAKLWNLDLAASLQLSCDFVADFINGLNHPNLSEDSRPLRQRAQRVCEDVPPPKTRSVKSPPHPS